MRGAGDVEMDEGDALDTKQERASKRAKRVGNEEGNEEAKDVDASAAAGKKGKKTKFQIEMLGGGVAEVGGIMSTTAFETLPVSEPTKNALRDTGFTHMTEVLLLSACLLSNQIV